MYAASKYRMHRIRLCNEKEMHRDAFPFFFFLARERVRCRRNRMQSKEKRMTFFVVVVVVASFLQQHDDTFLGSHCQPTARGKKLRSNSFMSTTRSRKIKICMKHKMPTPGNEHGCYSSTLITCFSRETIFCCLGRIYFFVSRLSCHLPFFGVNPKRIRTPKGNRFRGMQPDLVRC